MKGYRYADDKDVICTANRWLKEQDRQLLHNGIELWRKTGPSAFQLQESMLKVTKYDGRIL